MTSCLCFTESDFQNQTLRCLAANLFAGDLENCRPIKHILLGSCEVSQPSCWEDLFIQIKKNAGLNVEIMNTDGFRFAKFLHIFHPTIQKFHSHKFKCSIPMDLSLCVILTHLPWTKWLPFHREYFHIYIFLNENIRILIQISLKFVPKGPVDNKLALVLVMAWCWWPSLSMPICDAALGGRSVNP